MRQWACIRKRNSTGDPEVTAIIVNSRGEVFTGWHSACSISPSGYESYYPVPSFQKTQTIIRKENEFWPCWRSKRIYRTVGKPYVFSSRIAAEKAARKMHFHFGHLAVVS